MRTYTGAGKGNEPATLEHVCKCWCVYVDGTFFSPDPLYVHGVVGFITGALENQLWLKGLFLS